MGSFCLFCNDSANSDIYTYLHTLSLHAALPSCNGGGDCLVQRLRVELGLTELGGQARGHLVIGECGNAIDGAHRAAPRTDGSVAGDASKETSTVPSTRTASKWPAISRSSRSGKSSRQDRKSTRLNSSH